VKCFQFNLNKSMGFATLPTSMLDPELVVPCVACDAPMEPFPAHGPDNYFFCPRCWLLRVWPPLAEEA